MAYYFPVMYFFDFQPTIPQRTLPNEAELKMMSEQANSLLTGRTSCQEEKYYQIFRYYLTKKDLKTSKKIWSQEEDDALIELQKKGIPWTQISRNIQNTNQEVCKRRHKRLTLIQNRWPKEMDLKIIELANAENFNWAKVYEAVYADDTQIFPKHTLKQIKQRYLLNLKPGIRKQEWSAEEDISLLKLVNKFGTQWRKLSQVILGRTELQLKNRYYSILKPMEKKVLRKLNQKRGK